MPHHRWSAVLAAATGAAICSSGGAAARADASPPETPPSLPAATVAAEVANLPPTAPPGLICGPPYVEGDPDLGPVHLPTTGYLGYLMRGYIQFGGLSPQFFLGRYWNYITNDYRFPPDDGFAHSGDYSNGRLLLKTTFLQIGMELDRFGGYGGSFLAPLGDLYAWRALPPRNLNTNAQDPAHLCNYHAFRVLKVFRVEVGPVAPAFQQLAGGTQYHVLSKYIPEAPQGNPEVPVSWLLANGYLQEIDPPTEPLAVPVQVTSTEKPRRAFVRWCGRKGSLVAGAGRGRSVGARVACEHGDRQLGPASPRATGSAGASTASASPGKWTRAASRASSGAAARRAAAAAASH
ncbi:hypothetical protein BJ992_001522 [Sphaerisporangium rubeum]|uniref:TNT domain-containing protein n=1 Tax=Sphaerisporangium rubeum TaxID=321317 RepID=A0A7X0IBC9_9ACTN|nr:hypothetical protein [Sphaerisporangium rubeum]